MIAVNGDITVCAGRIADCVGTWSEYLRCAIATSSEIALDSTDAEVCRSSCVSVECASATSLSIELGEYRIVYVGDNRAAVGV